MDWKERIKEIEDIIKNKEKTITREEYKNLLIKLREIISESGEIYGLYYAIELLKKVK